MITCRSCGKTKADEDFSIKDGKPSNLCRDCKRERDRILYHERNKNRHDLLYEPAPVECLNHRAMIENYAQKLVQRGIVYIRESYGSNCPRYKSLTYVGKYGINYLFQDKHGCKYSYTATQLWSLKQLNEKEGRYKNVEIGERKIELDFSKSKNSKKR